MKHWAIWLPLALFGVLFAVFATGLIAPADRTIASQMIGKPLPQFDLPQAVPDRPALARTNFTDGKPKLLNVFASWCVPCIAEAPYLQQLADAGVEINGVAIRDRSPDVQQFLARNGNPYARIGADDVSKIQFDLGSSGVPETFVIDGQGMIRYQHIGDIRPEHVPMILQKLKEAQ
ncbi:DsbE family thiol:disulfide interchange protein [Blastomonas sp.]|uniref:DsbE family thiol:disulfide interchange protein n=1 Tax=Blastomonas sp. TaxID=1909299 RepID=UPI00262F4CF2|nr:DsbE family thiol:disulfide interchange protein [Blastomonas sp.]MDM7956474.1 DsbE family thiol:disulfide interchange protein [Blastomonas sp.]